uniref:Uncharacterized protein n=1 Tax=Arundo donax TaxID=35708 RepID=A0A0A8YV66_ARUDO
MLCCHLKKLICCISTKLHISISPATKENCLPNGWGGLERHCLDQISSFSNSSSPTKQINQPCIVIFSRDNAKVSFHGLKILKAFIHQTSMIASCQYCEKGNSIRIYTFSNHPIKELKFLSSMSMLPKG